MSSMHSWGLYNGRYGLSKIVLIDNIPKADRPIADRMLAGELDRQKRLKSRIAQISEAAGWIEDKHQFQNYKQLQFFDTLALYFNRIHPGERVEQTFEHVPLNAAHDVNVTIRPKETGVYELSPYPFAAKDAEFGFAGRLIEPGQHKKRNGWSSVLREMPTQWETFCLVAA
jgi:hypothetical protein